VIPVFQIPRNSLAWLLAAQTLLILPHLPRLPVWILLAWFITVLWRVQVFRGLWPFPRPWVKVMIVLLCTMGLLSEYGRLFGIEPMIGLLITAFLLKLLEMRQKRDVLIVAFLGYFVAATQFLFSQTLLTSLYILLTVTALTTALLGVHQSEGHRYPWRSFKLSATLIGQSIPLMLVLFIIMPRVGSLWAVPQPQQSAETGVSDTMAPGDFSRLVQDRATAFRVTFDGDIPPPPFLYWRGLVLSDFDGRRWEQSRINRYRGDSVNWQEEPPEEWRRLVQTSGEALSYQVILEPTQQHWLYALPVATSPEERIGITRDYRLVSRLPVNSRYQYRVDSHLNYRLEAQGLSGNDRARELSLPEGFNPQSLQQARQWFAEAGSERAYIDRVLAYFTGDFIYTLEPPLLGRHSVDEFMWQSKRGFCEHFASAFVVMMRAAGIPARVVVGYQGGELNPLKNFLVVRQAEAHAWSEIWLEGQGWVRVDPTAAVAPGRIELGLDGALSPLDADLLQDPFSLDNYSGLAFLNALRLRLEVLEYDWHQWVMDYDQQKQSGLLNDLLGAITPARLVAALLLSGFLVLGFVACLLAFSGRSHARDPGDKLYRRFLRTLKMRGIDRQPGEGPRALAERVERERPELNAWVAQVVRSYESYRYGQDSGELEVLRKVVKQVPGRRA
jgi:transglutaminase-like putative cysteine protease